MGCEGSKTLREEEMQIQTYEQGLSPTKVPVQEFVSKIKKCSFNHKLTIDQLKLAYEKLNLEPSAIDSRVQSESYLMNQLIEQQGDKEVFDERLMVLYGVLLCQGTLNQKAVVLFEEFDVNLEDLLVKDQIVSMVTRLFDIAITKIPTGFRTSPDCITLGTATDNQLGNYIKQLEQERANVVQLLKFKLLVGGDLDIGKSQFLARIQTIPSMIRAGGMRTLAADQNIKLRSS